MRIGNSHVYQPNEIVPISGQYEILTKIGERTGETVACSKNDKFPNVSPSNYGFLLAFQTVSQQTSVG